MAAVVTRTLSSSSTTSTRPPAPPRWPFEETRLLSLVSGMVFGQRGGVNGENDLECGAVPFGARHLDAPAVVAHDVLSDPEAEARALRARREERLEDAGDGGFGDAAPRVADLDRDGRLQSGLFGRGADADAPATLHRLLRVQQEVEEDLSELVGARAHARQRGVELADDLDAPLANLLLDEDQGLFEELVDRDPLDLARAPREAEHLADDVRDALGLLARHVEELLVLLQLLPRREQVERVLDGFERVVDLVRDGGGQAAHRRELLRLEELLLDASALKLAYLREVVQDRDDRRHLARGVEDFRGGDLHRQPLARHGVNEFDLGLAASLRAGGEGRDEGGELDGVVPDGPARGRRHALLILEERLGPPVEEDELARRVADGDGVADVFEDEVEAVALAPGLGLGLLELDEVAGQLFVGAPEVGHVAEDGDQPDALAARVEGRRGDDLEVDVRAFDGVNEREVAAHDLFGSDRRGRKVGGEEEVVHLKRAALALVGVAAVAEEFFGAAVLEEDFVVKVGEHDGVGHTLHDGLDPLPLALELAHRPAQALGLRRARQDDADAPGDAFEQLGLLAPDLLAPRADVEHADRGRARRPELFVLSRAEREVCVAPRARERSALEREGEDVFGRAELREEVVPPAVAVRARDPGGPTVVDDADVRRVRVEQKFEARGRRVVGEPGGAADSQHARPTVNERERRRRVAHLRGQRVEQQRDLVFEALRGQELRRHLEDELVEVRRQLAPRPLGQRAGRRRDVCQAVLHKAEGSRQKAEGSQCVAA